MTTLAGAVLTLATFGIIFWLRHRSGRPTDHFFALKLIGISSGVGSVTVGGVYPLGYVLVAKAINGGTIATNLPTGVTEDALLGMALIGAVVVVIGSAYGLIDHLKSGEAP